MKRRQAGFSFIEILVVMGIIVMLVALVAGVVPTIQEKGRQTKSLANVKNLVTLYTAGNPMAEPGKYPSLNGKNFVLWLVATNKVDRRETRNLETLFSPGDSLTIKDIGLEPYKAVTLEALRAGPREEFWGLTSYAGRRNKEKEFKITSAELERGTILICDDDSGAPHHSKGMVIGYSDGAASFVEWDELDIAPPNEENAEGLLGDNSPSEKLKRMSSQN